MKKFLAITICLLAIAFSGASAAELKSFVLGDTTFTVEHEEPSINPHVAYAGWACIRYGVGETLFRLSDWMEVLPWLADDWEMADDLTWVITLRPGIKFSSGRALDGAAVKECLENLIKVHPRAASDLAISSIEPDGQTVTIKTAQPNPTLLNALCDPYSCIVDMDASGEELVVGTGPYRAVELISGERLELVKNENYWNGTPGYDKITVRTISDGDTMTMALQTGEIDAAYGLPYASYPLFRNGNYKFSSVATSRTFFASLNFESEILRDPAVRRAVSMAIDKNGFVETLLQGCGQAAEGAFPAQFAFGKVHAHPYDPDEAAKILEDAGWIAGSDGIREKDGKKLTLRWLTYPSRQELPLLAVAAQAELKKIGVRVVVNCTADHNRLRRDASAWDIYASSMVTAPTGNPEKFFATHCLDASPENNGRYASDELENLARELSTTFDAESRARLALQMQQKIIDDGAFIFFSHLKMSLVFKSSVAGLVAHPCDFYEITADLRPAE